MTDLTEAVCLGVGDKFLFLVRDALEADLDLSLKLGETMGDSSIGLISGASRNSGLIAFNCGEAMGENGFA